MQPRDEDLQPESAVCSALNSEEHGQRSEEGVSSSCAKDSENAGLHNQWEDMSSAVSINATY